MNPFEEPPTPEEATFLIAMFDVLGFSQRIQQQPLEEILALYQQLIETAVLKEDMRCFGLHRDSEGSGVPVLFTLPARYAYFSDTILVWVPLTQTFVAPFIQRCADLASTLARDADDRPNSRSQISRQRSALLRLLLGIFALYRLLRTQPRLVHHRQAPRIWLNPQHITMRSLSS